MVPRDSGGPRIIILGPPAYERKIVSRTGRVLSPITGYELYLVNRYRPVAIIDCDGHIWLRCHWNYKINMGNEREVSAWYIDREYGIWACVY